MRLEVGGTRYEGDGEVGVPTSYFLLPTSDLLQFLLKHFPEFFQFGPDDERAVRVFVLVVLIIIMVIIFGWVEFFQGSNFRNDRFIPRTTSV